MHLFESDTASRSFASDRPRSWKLLSLFGAAVLLLAIQAGSRAETASADVCSPNGGSTLCSWEANLAPFTNRFFSAPGGNNLRSWFLAGVGDQHGGSVGVKCVNVLNSTGSTSISVACGPGFPSNPVPGNFRPGFLFTNHSANGARIITGAGTH